MRELRKDIESTLDSPKEELENMDEMKIEDVIMGLKGLKQEEVFSFLGKNNFTPSETEISSAGLGSYDQLSSVDTSEMEQLQLSFNTHFDGLQGIHSHVMQSNMLHVPKFACAERSRIKGEPNTSRNLVDSSRTMTGDLPYGWSPIKKEKHDEIPPQQHLTQTWSKYPGSHNYSLTGCPIENIREEEIIATNIAEEMISSDPVDGDEFKCIPPNNTYVVQSSVDGVNNLDKPNPIKLRIKRIESEDEITESPAIRMRSKRTRQPSAKRKLDETSAPPTKKRCPKRTPNKVKGKTEVGTTSKPKEEVFDDLDFPFSNTVHQDDDFVYPSLDLSDDEDDDIYIFSQRDDETWVPKNKMKIMDVKTERPTRDRKRNNAIAKCLEAAALKRADSVPPSSFDQEKRTRKSSRKKFQSTKKSRPCSNGSFDVLVDDIRCTYDSSISDVNLSADSYSLPSTSNSVFSTPSSSYCSLNTFSTLTGSSYSSELSLSKATKVRKTFKDKNKTPIKISEARIIPPKTCKLIQTPPDTESCTPDLLLSTVKKQYMKIEITSSSSITSGSSSCSTEKKSPGTSYVTKRGKPKKGMATAKQRLGKILKMHKMFF